LNPSKAKIKGVLFGLDIALNLYNVERIEKTAKIVYETLLNKGITHVVLAFDNDKQGLELTRLYMNYFVTRPEI
jgi:hypothetical protein